MIDFWARLDESDVEKYAKTLILPEYMSHLNLQPFSLSEQRESASGREPLTLVYVGDGRLEELELRPERDALPLIASLDLGVDPEKIRLPNSGAYWTWNDFGPTHPFFSEPLESPSNDNPSQRALRVYFEPIETNFSRTLKFNAQDAYVSVSRQEIFFSRRVLAAYLEARCRALLTDANDEPLHDATQPESRRSVAQNDASDDVASPAARPLRVDFAWDANFRPFDANYDENQPEESAAPAVAPEILRDATPCLDEPCVRRFNASKRVPKTPSTPPKFAFEVDDQNVRFRFGPLAGSLVAANGETFEDAIRFSGLFQSLTHLSDYVYYDPRNAAPLLDETGVRLRLTPVETDATVETNDI
jgi:hypothetical protein